MRRLFFLAMAALITLALLSACGQREYTPQPIAEGVEVCVICSMLVHDDRHATQIALQDGRYLMFDDIGCHHSWLQRYGEEKVAAQFVRDYHSEEWINFEKAFYAYDANFRTPMAYGIYSFEQREAAEQFIAQSGKGTLLDANELDKHHWQRNLEWIEKNKELKR